MNRISAFRRIRRIGTVVLAVVVGLGLTACVARGGGQLGTPLDGGPIAVFDGQATFGFTFTCEMRNKKAVIRGQLSYHDHGSSVIDGVGFPEIALHGVVDPFFVKAATCEEAAAVFPATALFEGTYRSDSTERGNRGAGRFIVQVFDQGEPARPGGDFTGDGFAIELQGGPFNGYTRGGFLEGGNVQVEE